MENIIVWTVVSAAAVWMVVRLVGGRPPGKAKREECGGNCSTCAFQAGDTGRAASGERGAIDSTRRLDVLPALPLALAAIWPADALAADTVETFDPGAANVELYFGFDGLGTSRADGSVIGDVVVGYGVADRLSAYLATSLQANGYLTNGQPRLCFGVIGTPVDTERFDLDLLLDVGAGGDGLSRLSVAPGVEANLDLDSPAGPWGLYLRASVPFDGEGHVKSDGSIGYHTGHRFELNPGIHWAPREGHQLLAEYALAWIPGRNDEPGFWENGGAALGYNVAVSETLELITQASVAPVGDRRAAGVMLGFIATIPGA